MKNIVVKDMVTVKNAISRGKFFPDYATVHCTRFSEYCVRLRGTLPNEEICEIAVLSPALPKTGLLPLDVEEGLREAGFTVKHSPCFSNAKYRPMFCKFSPNL